MSTSFNVNKADLEFILKQIQLAESTSKAYTATPLTILQAIQNAFNVSASDAAILPFGLRTVDGSDNNLLPGGSEFGAADTLFPRLTDPVFRNDQDGDQMPLGPPGSGAPTITNNDYGLQTSVADADPRIISNLVVDMTPANPAAVEAALRGAGYSGNIAAARTAIVNAYNNIALTAQAAHAAQLAENAGQATLDTETLEQAAAAAANTAAQGTLAAYNAALAQDVEVKLTAAQDSVDAMVTELGAVGSTVTAADVAAIDAAVLAASTAANAALAAYNALLADPGVAPADVAAALAVSDHAALLLTQVTALQLSLDASTPNLDVAEFNAAADANTAAAANVTAANAHTAQLEASQVTAAANAVATLAALTAANAAVAQDSADLAAATAASDAADTALASAIAAEAAAQTNVDNAQIIYDFFLAANQPFAQALAAYNNTLAENLDIHTAAANTAVADLVTSLGPDGSLLDVGDLVAADAAVAAAQTASDAAADAVAALQGGGANVVADDLADAQALAADALALLTQLQGLRTNLDTDLTSSDQLLDTADFNTAGSASTAAGDNATAATTLVSQLTASQIAAEATNAPSAANLAAALTILNTFTGIHDAAVQAVSDATTHADNMQLAENNAIADLAASELAQDAAETANTAAQAILTAYDAALALDVEVAVAATQSEAADLVASLGAVGSIVNAADHTAATDAVAAANAAATAAQNAADALLAALGAAHADVIAAQDVAVNAVALRDDLTALQSALLSASPLLDQSEYDAAQAALTQANTTESAANSADTQLDAAQAAADSAATTAFNALQTANQELADATTAYNNAVGASDLADAARDAARPNFEAVFAEPQPGIESGLEIEPLDSLVIPNVAPDAGLTAPFNSWMTFFGQFFDHGLDLVTKGNAGTVYIPLAADDPLIAGADGVFGTEDDLPEHLRFMALTRATVTLDANGVPQHENTTTSFVDQNQTYTSHPSHQVFLREYVREGNQTFATGRLIDGSIASGSFDGAPGNWAEVKAQALEMLGIKLSDFDVHNVPLLLTDQYGKFIPGANGYAQMVMAPDATHSTNWLKEGTAAGITTEGSIGTNHAFLNDIAHHAAPSLVDHDHDGGVVTPKIQQVADADIDANGNGIYDAGDTLTDVNGDGSITTADFFAADKNPDGSLNEITYDDEMLNAHFATGDGRGNENIALSAVHSVFHSEHNRIVDVNKATILNTGDLAFINEWLRTDIASLADIDTQAQKDALIGNDAAWDGERLFQAARFSTEMQYQHLVFEEFARRIQPDVDAFVFNTDSTIDPSILAEFAHTVYRFGHSMLTGTVDRLENDLTTVNGEADQATLLAAFLNPTMYLASGASQEEVLANLVRGTTRDVGNQIDEFIVQDVRSNLLGLPLDLAVLNISRGRDTGIPSLNETRQQLHDAGLLSLTPYTNWLDFENNINNKLSVINFMAAYGTHTAITSAATAAEARDAAFLLRFDDGGAANEVTIRGVSYTDRQAFLNGTGAYGAANGRGGVDAIDLWIGGLAEKRPEFGSAMLGSTFNYVFEFQMEQLQFGDRFYYLSRTQGTNFLNQLEPNTFSDLVMRNSELSGQYATHLSSALFLTPDIILELDRGIAQEDYNGSEDGLDPDWETPPSVPVEKVSRDYSNSTTVDGTHDFGGSITFRGTEHAVIGGTEGDDFIRSDEGDDTLWGDGGNDHLISGEGVDNVFGGDGDDIIEDNEGVGDFLRGERGNDVIVSARGLDVLFGGEGQDFVQVGLDAMEVFAGEGNDFVIGGVGIDFLLGNEGDDWMEGGGSLDTLAGDNSELFFNSPLIGHDVLFGQGDENDIDAESGDDIMGSAPSAFRNEGMFGFDWGIAKYDPSQIDFDLKVPIFTTDQADILRDRWDQVEALSGWNGNDELKGDDRGAVAGATAPSATTTGLFLNNELTQEGVNRIDGFSELLDGARATFGLGTTFREGNILIGGDGSDEIQGRGGYDILDGDAWLNVRIKIDMGGGVVYSAESLSTNTALSGPFAGKVYATDANGDPVFTDVQFGGRSLQSLLLDRTINPGQMSIVREIKYDDTPNDNNDTAVFQGTSAEYDIEGAGIEVEGVIQRAFDLNGDGFISVTDRDNGAVGATVNGVVLQTRGILTDDTDLLKNIELLRFADATIAIAGNNSAATGTVTLNDPTPFAGVVTPFVGQVLTPTLSAFADADGIPLDANNLPVGLSYEWQIQQLGETSWTTVQESSSYTVREEDIGHVIRAVAMFKDSTGVTERVYSAPTAEPTVAFTLDENSPAGTVVGLIPLPEAENEGVTFAINAASVPGLFSLNVTGLDANGSEIAELVVANSAPLDYEAVQAPADNQFQVVIDSFDVDGLLIDQREFTILLRDVVNEGMPTNINWSGTTPNGNTLPTGVIAQLSTVDPNVGATHQYQLLAGSAAGFAVSPEGVVTRTGAMAPNSTYLLNVRTTDNTGLTFDETFTIRTQANNVANVFAGTAGDEIVYGLSGGDRAALNPDSGLNGGAGDDNLFGQNGADTLVGEAGNDTLVGGPGVDRVFGGLGNDTIRWVFGDGVDAVIDGGADTDTVEILANGGNQALDVTYNGTAITNFEGNGALNSIERFTANLGAGTDTLVYTSAASVAVDLSAGTASGFASLAGVENVTGGAGSDVLTGGANANTLSGGGGNDQIFGDAGDDIINYVIGGGADTVDGGADNDTLNITDGGANNQLDVLYDGTVITLIEGGAITNIELVNTNMGGAADTLSYAGSSARVTVDLADGAGIGNASGFNQVISVLHVTGTAHDDNLSGNSGANILTGGDGIDTLNGEAGGDTLIGGDGADTIDTGAANDNVADLIRFSGTGDFGDTINNFDANGTVDRLEFGGALNAAYDDGNNNNNFLFATGNGGAGTVTVTVGQANANAEALYLSGANGEGVTNADLTNAALVAAAFNAEFNITAANNEDALLVINDTNGNSASAWQWIQNTAGVGNTAEVDASELTLIGALNANATVGTASFDFF